MSTKVIKAPKRYDAVIVKHGNGYTSVSVYDNKKTKGGYAFGHVMRFGQLGDGNTCMNTAKEATALARKVVRLLNGETK